MNIPGFTAESALSMAGRGHREIVNALTNDSRRSVFMALISQGDCRLESTLTVVENGVPSTTNFYVCDLVEVSGGGGGGPTPFEGGDGGGPGKPGRPIPERPRPERPPPRRPRIPEDIGKGPSFKTLKETGFECKGPLAPLQLYECHSCADTQAGRTCICYFCEPFSDQCTPVYDCTAEYA